MAQDVSRSRESLISRKHPYNQARLWRRWHRRSGNEVTRTFDIRALLEAFQTPAQELYSGLGRTAADELLVQMMAIDTVRCCFYGAD
jgi:hypothetical protein